MASAQPGGGASAAGSDAAGADTGPEAVADLIADELDRLGGSASRGALAIGITSALVNLGVKALSGRRRPDRAGAGVPGARYVPMPSSTSFPSGHSAAAFAFATAISRDSPWLAIAIQFLAGSVAYSRVHTGVHYPGDTIAGALIGAGAGQAVSSLFDRAVSGGGGAERAGLTGRTRADPVSAVD